MQKATRRGGLGDQLTTAELLRGFRHLGGRTRLHATRDHLLVRSATAEELPQGSPQPIIGGEPEAFALGDEWARAGLEPLDDRGELLLGDLFRSFLRFLGHGGLPSGGMIVTS